MDGAILARCASCIVQHTCGHTDAQIDAATSLFCVEHESVVIACSSHCFEQHVAEAHGNSVEAAVPKWQLMQYSSLHASQQLVHHERCLVAERHSQFDLARQLTRNVFCSFVIGTESPFVPGDKFFSLAQQLPDRAVQSIGFVGEPRAKHRIMCSFFDQEERLPPIQLADDGCERGDDDDSIGGGRSYISDITAYMGQNSELVLNVDGLLTFELEHADRRSSAGSSTTTTTTTATATRAPTPTRSSTPTRSLTPQGYMEDRGALMRHEVVSRWYPRLLHLFSNVLCFVGSYRGADTERQLLSELESFGRAAVQNVNHCIKRPLAVLVVCDVSRESLSQCELNVDKAADPYRQQLKALVPSLYHRIDIVYVPEFAGAPRLYHQQLESLHGRIRSTFASLAQLAPSNPLDADLIEGLGAIELPLSNSAGKAAFFRLFGNALRQLNRHPTDAELTLDFTEIVHNDPRAAPTQLADFVYEYFTMMRTYIEQSRSTAGADSFERALTDLEQRIARIYFMWRYRTLGAHAHAFLELAGGSPIDAEFERALRELDERLSREQPCHSSLVIPSSGAGVPETLQWCGLSEDQHRERHKGSSTVQVGRNLLSHEWFGQYERSEHRPRLLETVREALATQWMALSHVLDRHKTYVRAHQHELHDVVTASVNALAVCVVCVLDAPTVRGAPCGHCVCVACAIEHKFQCPLCNSGAMYPNKLPPLAGARVLAIDGGGVRGLIPLVVLSVVQEYAFGISIRNLFDLIVGTSAGGLLTLTVGRSQQQAKELISTFASFGNRAFVKTRLARWFGMAPTRYKVKALRDTLETLLPNPHAPLFTEETPHLALTSVFHRDGERRAALFTSYNRARRATDRVSLFTNATRIDAALATSAAPTYFPSHCCLEEAFIDGGMMHNNPSMVALDEVKALWPSNECHILVSLGTGIGPRTAEEPRSGPRMPKSIFDIILKTIDHATETERTNSELCRLMPDRSVRIQPELRDNFPLDDVEHSQLLIEDTYTFLKRPWMSAQVAQLTRRLLAACFYLHVESNSATSAVLQALIVSRCPLPMEFLSLIDGGSFSITASQIGITIETSEPEASDNVFQMPIRIMGARDTLRLEIMAAMPTAMDFEPELHPISGSPVTIMVGTS